jgi:flagellar motility protein MotE (MotC chaperone)
MMSYASLDPVLRTAGFCLVGVLVPAQAVAAEQNWAPVVVKSGKTDIPRAKAVPARMPDAQRAAEQKSMPGMGDEGVAAPSEPAAAAEMPATDIVGAIESTRMLSEADSARLAAAKPGEVPRDEGGAPAVTIPDSDLAQRYCVNIANAAADARIAWQKAKLAETEQEIGRRIAALEAKMSEYKVWLARRDEFSRKANETLVQIYAQMEPDAASRQLIAMDEETAAAVIAKLDARNSSAILNEMQPEKAARLTATIAGAARVAARKGPTAPAAQAAAGQPPVPADNGRGGGRQ